MALLTRGVISKLSKLTMAGHLSPGLLTLSKKSYSSGEDKNASANTNPSAPPVYMHPTSKWDKRMLVWTKRYPSMDQVPNQVSKETLDKARNKTRIYVNLIMGALTIIGSIAMIISGKRAAKRGQSVQQMNLDWHKSQ